MNTERGMGGGGDRHTNTPRRPHQSQQAATRRRTLKAGVVLPSAEDHQGSRSQDHRQAGHKAAGPHDRLRLRPLHLGRSRGSNRAMGRAKRRRGARIRAVLRRVGCNQAKKKKKKTPFRRKRSRDKHRTPRAHVPCPYLAPGAGVELRARTDRLTILNGARAARFAILGVVGHAVAGVDLARGRPRVAAAALRPRNTHRRRSLGRVVEPKVAHRAVNLRQSPRSPTVRNVNKGRGDAQTAPPTRNNNRGKSGAQKANIIIKK